MTSARSWVVVSVLSFVATSFVGCRDEDPPADAGPDPARDARAQCTRDLDCSNGVFCDGEERCVVGAVDADELGCVASAAPRCEPSQTCDEEADACLSDCIATPDADGDGVDAIACGGTDCDDADRDRAPTLSEICDLEGHDEDCDPETFGDTDGDGDGAIDASCCNGATCGTDCDDGDAAISPAADEICGEHDDDCDGRVDEGLGRTYYPDRDDDGYGDATGAPRTACTAPAGHAAMAGDCNDLEPRVHPGRTDVCDGLDNDCDGTVDTPGDRVYYRDADGDGRGDPSATTTRTDCTIPSGYIAVGGDCDDSDPAIHLGASERCNRRDDDCSEGGGDAIDEDRDEDGHAPLAAMCGGGLPKDDCDDSDARRSPEALETCNGRDDDCDGAVDTALDVSCGPGAECIAGACQSARRFSVGSYHACVVRGGEVYCWGHNQEGKLGDGTTARRVSAVRVTGLTDVVEVSAGGEHSCARTTDGRVHCWGDNTVGQLGTSSMTAFSATPLLVTGIPLAVEVTAGGYHTCIRSTANEVWCWGEGRQGQLGDGTRTSRATPARATAFTGAPAQVDTGDAVTCIRTDAGALQCVGDAIAPAVAATVTGATYVDVRAGGCAIQGAGALRCFGRAGTLGVVDAAATSALLPGMTDVVDVGLSGSHTCAVRANGTVWCWGQGTYGRLGDGGVTARITPVAVAGITDAVRVGAGARTTCIERTGGRVTCFGSTQYGLLGDGAPLAPLEVIGITDAVDVAAGPEHTCVRRADGTVACFGANAAGQLGDGTTTSRLLPVAVSGLAGVTRLEASRSVYGTDGGSTCATRAAAGGTGHELVCWGSSGEHQSGAGMPFFTAPNVVSPLQASTLVTIGEAHVVIASSTAGSISGLGRNDYGQLGLEPNAYRTTMTYSFDASPIGAVSSLSAARSTTCATRASDGAVYCFGEGQQLFAVQTEPYYSYVPFRITGMSGVEVVGGQLHFCLRSATGSVRCWGRNESGERGDGTRLSVTAPTSTLAITDAVQLAAGSSHTCARRASGAVACWGLDSSAQVSGGGPELGTCGCSTMPLDVPGLADAIDISAGAAHTCAVRANGRVVCWGSNETGQLGAWALRDVTGLP
ncbi:MopE-related protein [Sandaracinus amylolyticus]|uniref:MopE-related protein n=1 Tax=Sandaracinus amylolyticus TaxID=927083 RepID=UPI001F373189|nr:MopE-related protein [Sandaracinus amylolyticus]UJR86872.1 Hypothetical protein I5071_89730 [Sandaracinus amylolyticus]